MGLDQEADLIRRAASGEARAITALADQQLPRVHALAFRMLGDRAEAEDIAQEAFLRLWKALPAWTPGQARLSTWLYRVTTNLCIDRLRKARETALPEGYDAASDTDGPADALQKRQQADRVHDALMNLPERQRAALVLCHFEGQSNPEAAKVLGISVEAVESLLARGRRALKAHLTDAEDAASLKQT